MNRGNSCASHYKGSYPQLNRSKKCDESESTKHFEICLPHDSALPQNYLCSRYEKPRSSRGQSIGPSHALNRIICSRPKCAKFKSLLKDFVSPITLDIKINVYHGRSSNAKATLPIYTAELPGKSSLTNRVELPGGPAYHLYSGKHRSGQLPNLPEEPPPLVNISTKPSLIFRRKSE